MTLEAKTLLNYEKMDLLRFTTAGSVDDGKSTLIGRLLYDSKGVFEDQLEAIRRTTEKKGGEDIDFALITDGLSAEREQGITIDVAYRYFITAKRKFIIADTPGHEQYTRNMVTGASTADLAIILIDARNGVMIQSKRHGYIAKLLGIPHIVVAVNKMDLVDFKEEVFEKIKDEYTAFLVARKGQKIMVLPSGAVSSIKSIDTFDGELEEAWPPSCVTIRLTDEIDISRGDMLAYPGNEPKCEKQFSANLCWMVKEPLVLNKKYILKLATGEMKALVSNIRWVRDMKTLDKNSADQMNLNDIAEVEMQTLKPICFDPYSKNRGTGSFILIDELTNNTVAAGMIVG
jgi:small GTP-binding protein